MELLCCESPTFDPPVSSVDANFSDDERILENLLHAQERHRVKGHAFQMIQKDVTSEMRRILTTWMAEVCEDQCCEHVVLPLASKLLDRVLECTVVKKSQLQLLGSVCLLLASKLRQCRALGGELLCYYTDNSVTLEELLSWEMLVLGKLGWDVSSVTANDFLSALIARTPNCDEMDTIRQHAQIFISLCSTEYRFSLRQPSLVAASSLCAAAAGLALKRSFVNMMQATMQRLTRHSHDEISECVEQIEELFSSSVARVHQLSSQKRVGNQSSGSKMTPATTQEDNCQPETPTEVQDVHF